MRMTIDVRVGSALKEFIVSTNNGSDVLDPEKDTILWCRVKQHLLLQPGQYIRIQDRSEYISIILRGTKAGKTYSIDKGRKLQVNTLFRSYLDEAGQAEIRKHFEKEFKNVFRTYMKGCLNNNDDMKIIDAIEEFCHDHNIPMNKISTAMLQKDWYRYRLRCSVKNVCPLMF